MPLKSSPFNCALALFFFLSISFQSEGVPLEKFLKTSRPPVRAVFILDCIPARAIAAFEHSTDSLKASELRRNLAWRLRRKTEKLFPSWTQSVNRSFLQIRQGLESLRINWRIRLELKQTLGITNIDDSPFYSLLLRQEETSKYMAFLPPNLAHTLRVINNSRRLVKNPAFQIRLRETFGDQVDLDKLVRVAALFSRIGFSHPGIHTDDVETYAQNRRFAREILELHSKFLKDALNLNDKHFASFVDAVARPSSFRMGEELYGQDFANPLTALLQIAMDADISKSRLAHWQKSHTLMRAMIQIAYDPALVSLETQIKLLEIERQQMSYFGDSEGAFSGVDRKLQKLKPALREVLKKAIDREIISSSSQFQDSLRKENLYPPDSISTIYQQITQSFGQIDNDSSLWYLACHGVDETIISRDGSSVIIRRADTGVIFGAAAALPSVRDFYPSRLNRVTRDIRQFLGVDIPVETLEPYYDSPLYQLISRTPKAETHSHFRMAGDFEPIWNRLLRLDPESYSKDRKVIQNMGVQLNRLQTLRGRSTAIDLVNLLQEIRTNLDEINSLADDFSWSPPLFPTNMDDLIKNLQEKIVGLPPALAKIANKRIALYHRLKSSFRHLFDMQYADLRIFDPHLVVVNELHRIGESDPLTTLGRTVAEVMDTYQRDAASYVELRFSVSETIEDTLERVRVIIQGYSDWKHRQSDGKTIPVMRLILSLKRIPSPGKSEAIQAEEQAKYADVVVGLLESARHHRDENIGYPTLYSPNGNIIADATCVTPQTILDTIVGVDGVGQEEHYPPNPFFDAYKRIRDYNVRLDIYNALHLSERKINPLGQTFHVAESISDVSVESGLRHAAEAIFMKDFEDVDLERDPVVDRLGHVTVVGLTDYTQFLGTARREAVTERLRQIRFDQSLIKRGVPLLATSMAALEEEALHLTHFAPTDLVTIHYDLVEKIIDLETRAGYIRDIFIQRGVVAETNPTSNLRISPFIASYEDHTLQTFAAYRQGDWTRSLAHSVARLQKERRRFVWQRLPTTWKLALSLANDYKKASLGKHWKGKKVIASINTDDLLMTGAGLNEEFYRIARSQHWIWKQVKRFIDNGFSTAFDRPAAHSSKLLFVHA